MATEKYVSKISPRNKVFADKIRNLVKQYKSLGIIDVQGLPAPQFQRIRASLKGKAEVLIVKKNLIDLVLKEAEKSHKNVYDVTKSMNGIVGLIFTNSNPFTLFKFVNKNKSSAPAKAGAVAPKDIVVPAGPTSFAPGPIIGELGALKIKAGINAGKVEIKEDCVVAKEGDTISEKLAGILTRLGIEPMEVGLNIKIMYEDETLYNRKVLDVDEKAILEDLKGAAQDCFKLTIGLKYFTKENVSYLVGQAGRDSLSLGVGIAYPSAKTIELLVRKAQGQGFGVANVLPEDIRPADAVAKSSATPVEATSNSSASNEVSKKEEEKPQEEDAAASLGGFF